MRRVSVSGSVAAAAEPNTRREENPSAVQVRLSCAHGEGLEVTRLQDVPSETMSNVASTSGCGLWCGAVWRSAM